MMLCRTVACLFLAGVLACDPTPGEPASSRSAVVQETAPADWTTDTAVDATPIALEIRGADGAVLGSYTALRAPRGNSPDFPGTFLALDDWKALTASQGIVLSWDAASSRLTIGEQALHLRMVDPSKPEKLGVPNYGFVHEGKVYVDLSPQALHGLFPASPGSRQERSESGIVLRLE